MSTVNFAYRFLRPPAADYFETTEWLEDAERSQGGYTAVCNRASLTLFRCGGTIRLPQRQGATLHQPGDLLDFLDARTGRADTFLYLPVLSRNRYHTGKALGTGTGTETVFPFSDGTSLHKYLVNGDSSDAVTLKVYVAGVLKTLTADYTVSGNYTDPTVTFGAGVTGAVTVDYQAYVPVRFGSADLNPRVLRRRKADDEEAEEIVEFSVSLEEDKAGARFS